MLQTVRCYLVNPGSIMSFLFCRPYLIFQWFSGPKSKCWLWLLPIKPSMAWDQGTWRGVVVSSNYVQSLKCMWGGLHWVPPMSEVRLMNARERSFSIVVPKLWNSLPRKAYLAPSLICFSSARKDKTFKVDFFSFKFNVVLGLLYL